MARQSTVRLSSGELELPIRYEDGSAAFFYFLIPTVKASAMLGATFEPARFLPGKTIAAVCFFEYRKTTIGPYNELGIGLTVQGGDKAPWAPLDMLRSPNHRDTGFHVLHLPVTSAAAEEAGRVIWGLPKIVTEIPFRLEGNRFEGGVGDPASPDRHLFQIRAEVGHGLSGRGLDMILFNRRGGAVEKTIVNVHARFRTARCRKFDWIVSSASHPLCDTLRRLDLDHAVPLAVQLTDRFASELHGPEGYGA